MPSNRVRNPSDYVTIRSMQTKLFTIGYEGSRIEDFVQTLIDAGVTTLLDVREVPLSRKKGFSKSALRATLEANDIAYVHLRGLGDPKPGRMAARAGDYGLFRKIFNKHMKTATAQTELHIAGALAREGVVCLMCFERAHCECHRSIVANHLVDVTGLTVHNLTVTQSKPICHALPFKHQYVGA